MGRFGWIPHLTDELFIGPFRFSKASENHVREFLAKVTNGKIDDKGVSYEVMLSDRLSDRLLRRKHKIHLKVIHKSAQRLSLLLSVEGNKAEELLKGEATIYPNGLAKFQVEETSLRLVLTLAADHMHILIRDCFHMHIHHEGDLPLFTVEASDEKEAVLFLIDQYSRKFIEYKRMIARDLGGYLMGSNKRLMNRISRVKGELAYAKHFIRLFDLSSNLDDMENSLLALESKFEQRLKRKKYYLTLFLGFVALGSALFAYLSYTASAITNLTNLSSLPECIQPSLQHLQVILEISLSSIPLCPLCLFELLILAVFMTSIYTFIEWISS